MGSSIFLIVWVIWIIALLVLYHKVFTVYYFSLSYGLLKELLVATIVGTILTAITFYLWWVTAIIIILVGLAVMGKTNSKVPLVIAVILAIIVSIIGISARSDMKNTSSESAMNKQIVQEYMA